MQGFRIRRPTSLAPRATAPQCIHIATAVLLGGKIRATGVGSSRLGRAAACEPVPQLLHGILRSLGAAGLCGVCRFLAVPEPGGFALGSQGYAALGPQEGARDAQKGPHRRAPSPQTPRPPSSPMTQPWSGRAEACHRPAHQGSATWIFEG